MSMTPEELHELACRMETERDDARELTRSVARECDKLRSERDAAKRRGAELRSNQQTLMDSETAMRADRDRLGIKCDGLSRQVNSLLARASERQAESLELVAHIEVQEMTIGRLNDKLTAALEQRDAHKAEVDRTVGVRENLRNELRSARTVIKSHHDQIQALTAERDLLQRRYQVWAEGLKATRKARRHKKLRAALVKAISEGFYPRNIDSGCTAGELAAYDQGIQRAIKIVKNHGKKPDGDH
jgi:chromosome segregation ATPase